MIWEDVERLSMVWREDAEEEFETRGGRERGIGRGREENSRVAVEVEVEVEAGEGRLIVLFVVVDVELEMELETELETVLETELETEVCAWCLGTCRLGEIGECHGGSGRMSSMNDRLEWFRISGLLIEARGSL